MLELLVPGRLSACERWLVGGWRNTVGDLIEFFLGQRQPITGLNVLVYYCMKNRGVRIHRMRNFKQYYFNSIAPTSQSGNPQALDLTSCPCPSPAPFWGSTSAGRDVQIRRYHDDDLMCFNRKMILMTAAIYNYIMYKLMSLFNMQFRSMFRVHRLSRPLTLPATWRAAPLT